jgi:hypothetical protein
VVNKHAPLELSSLHDIHLPEAIGWWPLAPGWYVLTAGLVIACLLIGFLCRRYYSNGRAKRDALRVLAMYQKQYLQDANSQLCAANISELLKRVALAYYPRTQVAGLQGEAWIAFLNSSVNGVNFNSVRRELLELPWRPSQNQSLQLLFKTVQKWIMRQGKPCSN